MNPQQRALLEVLQYPPNRTCADCRAPLRDNVHCAMRFGVFVCINCSAAHTQTRSWSLEGVNNHLKSVRNDKWSHREVLAVQKMGNAKMNALLERYVPANWRRPPPDAAPSVRARWIEAKYVRRLFVLPDYTGEYACPQDLLSAAQGKHLVVGEGGVLLDGNQPMGRAKGFLGGKAAFSALSSISHATGVDRVLPTRLVDYFVTCGAPLTESQPNDLFLEDAHGIDLPPTSISSSGGGGGGGGNAESSGEDREASSFARKPEAERLALALSGLAAVRFRPVVLDSYPSKDDAPHPDCVLPDHTARFAFPEGFGLGVTCVSTIAGFGYGGSGDVDVSVDVGESFSNSGSTGGMYSPNRRDFNRTYSFSNVPPSPAAGGGGGGGGGVQPPVHFSFVLTDASSVKLYATALRVNEEIEPRELAATVEASLAADEGTDSTGGVSNNNNNNDSSEATSSTAARSSAVVKSAMQRSASHAARQRRAKRHLLRWLRVLERHNDAAEAAAAASQNGSGEGLNPDAPKYKYMVLAGKALVVVSHYPFFNLFRTFLKQLYRVSLSDSPLPIERYVANFCSEIPLPPRGQVEVKVALPDKVQMLRRAPKNDLPSLDYSLRPLLSLLDVDNVLTVFECLLAEAKICLISRHLSLLTPVAAGLVALLFPFEWQGAFIPVMPASMIEVLDAPVPFFVGVHADALESLYGSDRPKEVVYVFLDENKIDLPHADDNPSMRNLVSTRARGIRGDGYWRAFDKVRKQLTKLIDRNDIGESSSSDGGTGVGANGDHYGRQKRSQVDPLAAAAADAAFPLNEHLVPIHSFGLETGILERRKSSMGFGSPRSPNQAKQLNSAGKERPSRFGISRQRRHRSRSRPKTAANNTSSNSNSNSNAVAAASSSSLSSAAVNVSAGHMSDGGLSSGGEELPELTDDDDDNDTQSQRRRSRSVSPFRNRGSGNNSPSSGASAGGSGGESGGEGSGGDSRGGGDFPRNVRRPRPRPVAVASSMLPSPTLVDSSSSILPFPPPPPFLAPSMQAGAGREKFYNVSSFRGVGLHNGIGHDEPEFRYTFLRFFLFVFQGYEKYVADVTKQAGSKNSTSPSRSVGAAAAAAASSGNQSSLFDRDGFLSSDHLKGLSDASHNALSSLISSQMFERFLQEFVAHDQRLNFNHGSFDQSEIRYFNEKILEKQNRSTFSSAHPTPFLADKSDAHAETFQPPPPSNWGLPDDGRVYNYTSKGFPSRFSRNLFGSVRPPAALVKSAELVRTTSSMALSAHAMMLHANKDSLAGLSAVTAAAEIDGAAGTTGRRGRRPSGEAKMLELNQNRLAIPDCRSRIGKTCRGMDRFRAVFRGWRLRRANRDKKFLRQGILLQSVARRWLRVRLNERQSAALVRISRWMHVHYGRRRRRRQKWASALLCRAYRGFRVWHAYQSLRDATLLLQSAERGRKVRVVTRRKWSLYLSILRSHLFRLWQLANTSVVYRSRFWALFAPPPAPRHRHRSSSGSDSGAAATGPSQNDYDGDEDADGVGDGSIGGGSAAGYSFLCLAIHEDEITKLWGELGFFSAAMTTMAGPSPGDESRAKSGTRSKPKISRIPQVSKQPPAVRTATSKREAWWNKDKDNKPSSQFNSFPQKLRIAIRLLEIYVPMLPDGESESSNKDGTNVDHEAHGIGDEDKVHEDDEVFLSRIIESRAAKKRAGLPADKPPWADRGAVMVAAGRLHDERRLFYEKLKQRSKGMNEARREAFFKLFGIAGQKKRKQTLAERLWQRSEEADWSSHVVLATFEGGIGNGGDGGAGGGNSGGVSGGGGGGGGGGGVMAGASVVGVVLSSPQDFMHQKRLQRIRFDVLATVDACLVSIQMSHRKLHPDKRALNKMRRKKKQFLRFISEHERAPSFLARRNSFVEVAISPRHSSSAEEESIAFPSGEEAKGGKAVQKSSSRTFSIPRQPPSPKTPPAPPNSSAPPESLPRVHRDSFDEAFAGDFDEALGVTSAGDDSSDEEEGGESEGGSSLTEKRTSRQAPAETAKAAPPAASPTLKPQSASQPQSLSKATPQKTKRRGWFS